MTSAILSATKIFLKDYYKAFNEYRTWNWENILPNPLLY